MTEILGQSRAMGQIQAAVSSGRLHHAWIFHGPWGVGKFTAALELARFLLCHDPQTDLMGTPSACDACASCKLFHEPAPEKEADADAPAGLELAHPDFRVVTKELARYSEDALIRNRKLTSIPADVIREALLEPVYRRPQMGHGKVFVVDEAELIERRVQNLMLKTLEEPPPATYIILVTSSEDKLLTTIRSRCQRVAFGSLSDEVIHGWLDRRAPDLAETDRRWLVNFADGSLGRVELTLRFDLFRWGRSVLPGVEQAVARRPPGTLGATMSSFMDELAQSWVSKHKNASKEAANKMAAGLMLSMIAQHARLQLARLAQGAPTDDPDAAQSLLEPWLHVIESLDITETALRSNVNMGLAMDHLVAMMARPGAIHFSEA